MHGGENAYENPGAEVSRGRTAKDMVTCVGDVSRGTDTAVTRLTVWMR